MASQNAPATLQLMALDQESRLNGHCPVGQLLDASTDFHSGSPTQLRRATDQSFIAEFPVRLIECPVLGEQRLFELLSVECPVMEVAVTPTANTNDSHQPQADKPRRESTSQRLLLLATGRLPARLSRYQLSLPGAPLNGPVSSGVIHPP
jgi:hypothetical protein